MIIEPKVRGFICTAAHPAGCYKSVQEQIDYVQAQGKFNGPKNVLIIGGSTGYGLASGIVTTFGAGAKTIRVFFERAAEGKRTASAGWYNSAAFEQIAHKTGYYAQSINGDAFSEEIKQQTADLIRRDLGKVDCVIYSLASPRRTNPRNGRTYNSTLKPIGSVYSSKTVDPMSGEIKQVTIAPANEEDIENTIAVMGGEDWRWWIDYLKKEDLLTDDVMTLAYTYIGPELTFPIYKEGTIGRAKNDLQMVANQLNAELSKTGGRALISVNKALVTQASSAIPVVPLYMSILFKIMKENGTHEGCIEQMERLFKDGLYGEQKLLQIDEEGRIRIDDWEMDPNVQKKVSEIWQQINTSNVEQLADIEGYRNDFYHLFGFNYEGIDYSADVNPDVVISSLG